MSSNDDDARERAEQRTLLVPRREQGTDLKRGHALQEFVVDKVLGVGGSSIVYLAQDTKLGRRVAVKEYLPGTIAMRARELPRMKCAPRFFLNLVFAFQFHARLGIFFSTSYELVTFSF